MSVTVRGSEYKMKCTLRVNVSLKRQRVNKVNRRQVMNKRKEQKRNIVVCEGR